MLIRISDSILDATSADRVALGRRRACAPTPP